MDSRKAISDYSLFDPLVRDNPFEFYSLLHEQCPVYRMPENGFYVVTKYNDLRTVLTDVETFSSDVDRSQAMQGERGAIHKKILEERGWPHLQVLQRADAPEHRRHRRLVEQVFTRKRVQQILPDIEREAKSLVDDLLKKDECDFMQDFAMPLPARIMAAQVGLGTDYTRFRQWADAIVAPGHSVLTEEQLRECAEIELEAQHFLVNLFEERRKNPKEDIISGLVNSNADSDDPLSTAELLNIISLIIAAGFHTTTYTITNALWALIRFPDQMKKVRGDLSLMENVMEETIRFESTASALRRRATKDTELGGTKIPKGSTVITCYAAANRDPDQFECPHQFDVERSNVRSHLAFGHGMHFCIGAALARQEVITGLTEFISRTDNVELARPLPTPAHIDSFVNYALKELPIRFTKRGIPSKSGAAQPDVVLGS